MEGLAVRRHICSPRLAARQLPLDLAVTAVALPAPPTAVANGLVAWVHDGRGRPVGIRNAHGLPSSVTGLAVP
jgi:hypothetical protein